MKKIILLFLFLIIGSKVIAQGGEKFIDQYYKLYYSYGMFGVKSIEVKLSTPEIIDYLGENGIKDDHYLISSLFTYTGDVLFKPLPPKNKMNSVIKKNTKSLLIILEKKLRGIFSEFNLFIINTPFWDIPKEYEFLEEDGLAIFKYLKKENNQQIKFEKYFDKFSGILKKQFYTSGEYQIQIYPSFKKIDGFMLCTGWDIQIYKQKKIVSGTGVRFDYNIGPKNLWVPTTIKILTQVAEKKNNPVWMEIFLHDFKFNWQEKK